MSEENVEIVRALYDALNRGDWEGVFRDTHPEVEVTTQRGTAAGTSRGHEAVKRKIEDLLGPFETWTLEPEEFFEVEDYVVVFVKTRARPVGSSVEMEVRNGHLWTVQDGTIRSLKTFAVREEALEAAGLSQK